jgi:hypothetical protein
MLIFEEQSAAASHGRKRIFGDADRQTRAFGYGAVDAA